MRQGWHVRIQLTSPNHWMDSWCYSVARTQWRQINLQRCCWAAMPNSSYNGYQGRRQVSEKSRKWGEDCLSQIRGIKRAVTQLQAGVGTLPGWPESQQLPAGCRLPVITGLIRMPQTTIHLATHKTTKQHKYTGFHSVTVQYSEIL